jgi:hypothetical protein
MQWLNDFVKTNCFYKIKEEKPDNVKITIYIKLHPFWFYNDYICSYIYKFIYHDIDWNVDISLN